MARHSLARAHRERLARSKKQKKKKSNLTSGRTASRRKTLNEHTALEHRTSDIEHRTSTVEHRLPRTENRKSTTENRKSKIDHRKSNINHRTSNPSPISRSQPTLSNVGRQDGKIIATTTPGCIMCIRSRPHTTLSSPNHKLNTTQNHLTSSSASRPPGVLAPLRFGVPGVPPRPGVPGVLAPPRFGVEPP